MRRERNAWIMFDWAAQPFHTLVVTFIFIPYFRERFFETDLSAQLTVSIMGALSGVMVAIFAPLGGAISDQGGRRKLWIFALSLFYVFSCLFLTSANVVTLILAYSAAYFFIEMLLVFTNAYLPELTSEEDRGYYSGLAWGLGYIGGLIGLAVYLVALMPAPGSENTIAGLAPLLPENSGAMSGPISGFWYVLFMIPFFLFVRDTPAAKSLMDASREGLSGLKSSFLIAWQDRGLFWFFFSSLLYRDAMAGIFIFGTLYAGGVLDWSLTFIAIFGIVLNIAGIVGGVFGGWLDRKIGPFFVVRASLWGFLIVCIVGLSTNLNSVLFVNVGEGSQLPHIVFFICGILMGSCTGSLQGASRGMVSAAVKGRMSNGEAFGFYGMMGRATAFLAPALVLVVSWASGSVQIGVWPIVFLFLLSIMAFRKFEAIAGTS